MSALFAFAAGAAASLALAEIGAPAIRALARRRVERRAGSRGSPGQRLVGVLARAGVRLRPAGTSRALAVRLAAAGLSPPVSTRDVMAAKAGAAVAACVAALPFAAAAPGRLGLVVAVAAPVAGFLAPDLWLARHARARLRAARRELPGLLDLLRVSVEAGRPIAAALGEVGARSSGPLGREWVAVARQVELGEPLAGALARLAARLPGAEIETFAAAAGRAARHGSSLAPALRTQARSARSELRRAIEEAAAKAAPKIQLVVALLLVPSVLLVVAAALAAALGGAGALV